MSFVMRTEHVGIAMPRSREYRKGDFFAGLSATAVKDLESLLIASPWPAHTLIFAENQPSTGIVFVLEGAVKLSINSGDRRLIIRIAKTGEVLGLHSTISGGPHVMTAEALYPIKVARLTPQTFLRFLARHPEAYGTVARETNRSFNATCEKLRALSLSPTVRSRLAHLLLGWSQTGENDEGCAHCRLAFTHEEIGEFIGASREAVCRALTMLKYHRLVVQHGSTLVIPSREALEKLASGNNRSSIALRMPQDAQQGAESPDCGDADSPKSRSLVRERTREGAVIGAAAPRPWNTEFGGAQGLFNGEIEQPEHAS
jgi:CRP/FNR family transcriptional regulator, cyclic AMP receptor protein